MRNSIALILALAVAGCTPAPPKTACDDFRIMTFYWTAELHGTGNWSLAETRLVCIVGETKIDRPK